MHIHTHAHTFIHLILSDKWRNDNRCGHAFPLVDGRKAECKAITQENCCSSSFWCGVTNLHCACDKCTRYSTPE